MREKKALTNEQSEMQNRTSYSFSLSLTHTHKHSLTHTLSLSLTLPRSVNRSLSVLLSLVTQSFSQSLTRPRSQSLAPVHKLSCDFLTTQNGLSSRCFCLSLAHFYSLSLSVTLARALSLTLSRSLTLSLLPSHFYAHISLLHKQMTN